MKKAADIMTRNPVCVGPDAKLTHVVRLMLQRRISGLPVVDANGELVGMLTEGDLLRRTETGTERHRPRWIEFFLGPRLASEYAHTHGRNVHDVMSTIVYTIAEDTPLDEIVKIMESRRIKRLPIMRDRRVAGIVSRADLLRALASVELATRPTKADDSTIRKALLAELDRQAWAPVAMVNVIVSDGVVHLWGAITDERQRQGIRVAAENTPGVKAVRDHLVWVEPHSRMVLLSSDEEAAAAATRRAT